MARECLEELGVHVEASDQVGEDVPLAAGRALLRVYRARLLGSEQPQLLEHAELRWLARDELDSVSWLPADAPIVAALAATLGESSPGQRNGRGTQVPRP